MNRNSFLKAGLAVTSFVIAPLAGFAGVVKKRIDKGITIKAGKDRFDKPISLMEGDTFYTKVSTKDTDGDLYIVETTRVVEGGPSYHLHYDQDEIWYILKGEFLFKVGEDTFTAKAGDTVFGPRNVPHSFSKQGKGEAKVLIAFQPAGKAEEMFEKISQGAMKNKTEEEMDKFRHEHGIKKIGPALKYFKKW